MKERESGPSREDLSFGEHDPAGGRRVVVLVGLAVVVALVAAPAVQAVRGLVDGGQRRPTPSPSEAAGRAASPIPTPSAAPTQPWLDVSLVARPQAGTRRVVVDADHAGLMHEYLDGPTGEVIEARTLTPTSFELSWGDGSPGEGGEGAEWSCSTSTPLRPVELKQQFEHVYERPGTYVVTLTVSSCLPGDVVRRDTVVVR